jgi:uncharacterized protein (DUF305 family)
MPSNHTTETHSSIPEFRTILAQFITFLAMFVGAGFISGGIVHLGEGINAWDLSLLSIGVALFVVGSYVQEALFNRKNLKEEGVLPFLFFSLVLSIGVGMASGGIQHFVDTPEYSAYLIPIGLAVGILAFVLKQNYKLSSSQWAVLISAATAGALLLGIVLRGVGAVLPQEWRQQHGHSHGSHSHDGKSALEDIDKQMGSAMGDGMMMMDHPPVTSDADFIMGMIPHHQEAVETSEYMLSRTDDPEFRAFLQNIIDTQQQEIEMMKQWHEELFNSAYRDDGRYKPMMPDLKQISDDQDARTAYLRGMIMHHRGAIQMAEQIHDITTNDEIHVFADTIIEVQAEEIRQMMNWLGPESMMQGGGMMHGDGMMHE